MRHAPVGGSCVFEPSVKRHTVFGWRRTIEANEVRSVSGDY